MGDNFLANYNVTILDRGPVTIGNDVLIGPGTVIATVGHPLSPQGRREHLSYMRPVNIGNDVWIGSNVTILPCVTIGNNVVIAAGAVVCDVIPSNCMIAGVPARIVEELVDDGLCAQPSSVTTLVTEERREGIASFRMLSFGETTHLYTHSEEPSFAARFCECYTDDTRHG